MPERPFQQLSKTQLHELADGILREDPTAIASCVDFVCSESSGLWHGRARAMMCRRLKHCPITDEQHNRLVACIIKRLTTGQFSEQFRDQLRLALQLDPERIFSAAKACHSGTSDHVNRLSTWVFLHQP